MARGSVAKEEITQKILKEFEGSFIDGKEIRIPWVEDGVSLQIKVALTCAKVNIEAPGDAGTQTPAPAFEETPVLTQQEKDKVNDLIERLGL